MVVYGGRRIQQTGMFTVRKFGVLKMTTETESIGARVSQFN